MSDRLVDILPAMSALNAADMGRMNGIVSSYVALPPLVCKNVQDLFFCQFRILPLLIVFAALLSEAVSVVVSLRSYSQMFWVNAWRIIADVHHYQSFRNRTVMLLVKITMGANRYFSRKKNNAVSIAVFCSAPFPTSRIFFDVTEIGNIAWTKNRKFVQPTVFLHLIVMRAAQLPTNSHRFAQNALDAILRLIRHIGSSRKEMMGALYVTPMEVANV